MLCRFIFKLYEFHQFMIKFLHISPLEIFVSMCVDVCVCVCLCQRVNEQMNVYIDKQISYESHNHYFKHPALSDFVTIIYIVSLYKTNEIWL